MKRLSYFFIGIFLLFLLTPACRERNLSPKESIDCPDIGIQNAHPNSTDYQAILDKYVGEGYPGISAVVYTPDGLWAGTSGLANVKKRIALHTCHTMFSGSVAKMYTVASALYLVEQGLLKLDDKVSLFLPQEMVDKLPNAKLATVRQLMNHSAGMPDHDNDEALNKWVERNDGALPSAIQQMEYLYDDAPLFAPGQGVEYSSAHTVVLGLIIDKVAGEHHSNIISEQIIQKLGLTNTYYKNETGYPSPNNLIRGYLGEASKNEDLTEESINYCLGSQGDAGIIATAHDYYLFLKGLTEGNILSLASVDTMYESAVWPYDDGTHALGLGLGIFLIKKDGILTKVGHSGGTLGGMTHVYHYPAHDAYLVLATNTLIEEDEDLIKKWTGAVLVGTGSTSVVDDFENLILR